MHSRDLGCLGMLTLFMLVSSLALSHAQTSDEERIGANPSTGAYYHFRSDASLCPGQSCSGGMVKLANQMTTPCVDGTEQEECYVAFIDYSRLFLSDEEHASLLKAVENDKVIFEGHIEPQKTLGLNHTGYFVASRAWIAVGDNPATGTHYHVSSKGRDCQSKPCTAYYGVELNNMQGVDLDDVVLTLVNASEPQINQAFDDIDSADGVLIAGVYIDRLDLPGNARVLVGSQFYLQYVPNPCVISGCSGQICSDKTVITSCEWRPEYACYQTTVCEPQLDGQCGWTETPELRACLDKTGK